MTSKEMQIWARDRRILILQELGFEVWHNDSDIEIHGYHIDFRGVHPDPKSLVLHAVLKVAEQSRKEGRNQMRGDLKGLLLPED